MKKQIAVLSLLISVMGWAQEEKPQTQHGNGSGRNQKTARAYRFRPYRDGVSGESAGCLYGWAATEYYQQ